MNEQPPASPREAQPLEAQTREERLAAKLRENLRRRKAQAREMAQDDNAALPKSDSTS